MRRLYTLLLLACSLAGCSDKIDTEGKPAWLSVECLTDKSVETRAGDEPGYSLMVENQEGEQVYTCEDCASISERILLKAGMYRVVASSGEDVETGFEAPLYRAEQEVDLQGGETKQIALVCSQANVKVTVDYSEAIKRNFKQYSLLVENGKGNLLFEKDETRAGYLRVNEGTLAWNLTLHNGQEEFHLNKTIQDVKARQHYHFTFDIREDGDAEDGALMFGVVVDTTLDVYHWLCEIALKEKFAMPEIARLDGGKMRDVYTVLNETRGANIALQVKAKAGMSNLSVSHHSEAVKALGVPERFVLTGTTAEVKTAVNGAGITWTPEDASDKQEAEIDFSGLANCLPLGDYEFYVSVYDAASHLVNDTLRISVIPDIDHIADEVNVMDVWAKFATLRGRWYTATRPEGMALEYSKDGVNWTKAEVTYNEALKTCTAFVKDLDPATTYHLRSVTADGVSDMVRTFTTEGAEQVPYLNFDDWFKDGKTWYLGKEGNSKIWDSGNKGANTVGEKNPTAPDYTNKVDLPGNEASAYLETKTVVGVMAAGNLYTGSFVKTVGTSGAILNFGIPYTLRPTVLRGYYKYQPKSIDKTKSPYNHLKGKTDSCYIYVALLEGTITVDNSTNPPQLVDLSKTLAFGELKTDRQMDAFEPFEIKIKYQDLTKRPTHILIVASASKYGDYFTGAEGSKLWIDEFELGFDPVE